MKNTKKTNRSRFVIPGIIAVLLLAGGASAWQYKKSRASQASKPPAFAPISAEQQAANSQTADQRKEKIIESQKQQNSTPPAGSRTVTPVITYAGQSNGQVEVVAFVPNLLEDGGTCTVTITRGSQTVTRQVSATRNARTTDCRAFAIPESEFKEKGSWDVRVSYASLSASGTSEVWTLNIQ